MTARKTPPSKADPPAADSAGITEAATQAGDVHWKRPGAGSVAACSGRETRATLTTDRLLVSCGRCRGSRAWIRSADPEPDPPQADSGGITPGADARHGTAVMLRLATLAPHPCNPRGADLGDLAELQASIAEVGVLQPAVVVTVAAHLAAG
jgi:hypothetical protein